MAALTGTRIASAQVPYRDLQARQETWAFTTESTGAADEWVDVGSEILGVVGRQYLGAGIEPGLNVVMNASGTSITAGANPGNLAVEANTVAGTHTWHVTVIVR